MRLNCLFWNAGRGTPDCEIVAIAQATSANLIALAEYGANASGLLRQLNENNMPFFVVPSIACERITLLTMFQPGHLVHFQEADRFTIKELAVPGTLRVLLCMAHLPSKQYASDVDQLHTASYFKHEVELAETAANHTNTVVFGDFNMNPFDMGMISAAAMNSLPCLTTALRETRTISGRRHSFFYNPTWNLLGDFRGPAGTFFHKAPGYLSHYWNTLDQVVLRPSIADRFDRTSFSVVTMAGSTSLITDEGRPSVSDHLPIFFSIDIT